MDVQRTAKSPRKANRPAHQLPPGPPQTYIGDAEPLFDVELRERDARAHNAAVPGEGPDYTG